jgi:serine/threonine protein phosphatase PrpC
MSFTLVEQLSLPGDAAKPNEDALACLMDAALVLDGATPLGPSLLPGPSDAAWIAQFGARRLAAHLKDGDPPHDALQHALADAEKSFAGLARAPIREKWQTPCAALMMVVVLGRDHSPPRARSTLAGEMPVAGPGGPLAKRSGGPYAGPTASEGQRERQIEFLWFGDCAAIVAQAGKVEIVGETLKKRKAEAARAQRIAREKKLSSALGVNRPEVEPLLRAARNRINSGQNWLFTPDARAAAHVARRTMTVQEDALLLIASDGFLALVSDYGAYDAAGLMAAATDKGLAALGEELRAIEEDDARGEKFLRFKKSDDATAVLLRVN